MIWRELQAASRRKFTRQLRFWTALLGLGLSVLTYGMLHITRLTGGSGSQHFMVFAGYTLFISLLAGVMLTADSISQERREGTLGLLFISGLGPWDVLAGKLAATSVAGVYAMLGLLPLMAIPILAGGVTGGEFLRVSLALINGLWFALAFGLMLSVLCRESGRALLFAAVLLLLGSVAALTMSSFGAGTNFPTPLDLVPVTALLRAQHGAYVGNPSSYWQAFAICHAFGWVWIVIGSLLLGRTWQGANEVPRWAGPFRKLRPGRRRHRPRENESPVWRLAHPGRLWTWLPWIVVIGLGIPTCFAAGSGSAAMFMALVSTPISLLLTVLIAGQACRFFVETRRNGTLELLLGTPLTDREIMSGHWSLLRRLFVLPVVVSAALSVFLTATMTGNVGFEFLYIIAPISLVGSLLNYLAAAYVGTWLSLTMRKPQYAFGLTLLLVVLLPRAFCGLGVMTNLILFLVALTRLGGGLRPLWLAGKLSPS